MITKSELKWLRSYQLPQNLKQALNLIPGSNRFKEIRDLLKEEIEISEELFRIENERNPQL